ncbi:hypothetical protein L6452_13332 [Arctium lappa]|uniref:Uncharacterized protein n=1 Tax=Arctium lappa TaxID=4217 RepID=A0ACB9CHU5_ARCLA|nr:hypothetical protein L6452_13332 [Arctium lappa]
MVRIWIIGFVDLRERGFYRDWGGIIILEVNVLGLKWWWWDGGGWWWEGGTMAEILDEEGEVKREELKEGDEGTEEEKGR